MDGLESKDSISSLNQDIKEEKKINEDLKSKADLSSSIKIALVIPSLTIDEILAAEKFFGRFNTKLLEKDKSHLQSFLKKFEAGINDAKIKFSYKKGS